MMQKDTAPVRQGTIEKFGFWFRTPFSDCYHGSIVPFLLRHPDYGGQAGTDSSLKTLTQSGSCRILGYFRQVPSSFALRATADKPGLIFSNPNSDPDRGSLS
jgi:hypothetical protein